VLEALKKFWKQVPDCRAMVSDQDASFLAEKVVDEFVKRKIKLTTTTDNDHHSLGIINRLMRTLRDLKGSREQYFTEEDMRRQVDFYNDNIHSATKEAPNDITKSEERAFIEKKTSQSSQARGYDFQVGDYVRFLKPLPKLGKIRENYTKDTYKIIQRNGRSFVIQAKDGSTDTVPGFQLAPVLHKDLHKYPQGSTLKGNKRGAIQKVESYSETKKKTGYMVKFEGQKKKEFVTERTMREGAPTELSLEEKRYWFNHRSQMPERILKMVPKLTRKEKSEPLNFSI
jgi:hypothetical protein